MHHYAIRGSGPEVAVMIDRAHLVTMNPKGTRAIITTRKVIPTGEDVREVASFENAPKGWLTRTPLDDLHEKFLENVNPSDLKASRARDAWQEATAMRAECEGALEKALKKQEKAARGVVLAQGRGPMNIGKVIYDPGCSGTTVYFTKRR